MENIVHLQYCQEVASKNPTLLAILVPENSPIFRHNFCMQMLEMSKFFQNQNHLKHMEKTDMDMQKSFKFRYNGGKCDINGFYMNAMVSTQIVQDAMDRRCEAIRISPVYIEGMLYGKSAFEEYREKKRQRILYNMTVCKARAAGLKVLH